MKKFVVNTYQIFCQKVCIEAEDAYEAADRAQKGEGEPVEAPEFVDTCDSWEILVDEDVEEIYEDN